MQRIANEFIYIKEPKNVGYKSPVLNEAVSSLPVISDLVVSFLEKINPEAARADDKCAFFRESEETDEITQHKLVR